ncbi:hypothetical protein PVAP13_4KG119200 [Panicum virgatum]|uniref:Kazal-like domain-containing protein n=1 Tax=Panicum virgatum TaxID=38727 RepID=A0A8T0TPL6_PANVG|nr:hypothetical protein PVAP13_4KG119200 [Panicum virgatum]
MASGAASSLKAAATIAVACICMVAVLSSSEAAQMLCCKCDQYCSSSTGGCTSSFCGSACGSATSPGCLSCKQAYFSKCKNLCINYCQGNCVSC